MEVEARKRDKTPLKKQDRELLDSILAEVSRMRSIVAGLLSLVRTEEGTQLEAIEINLARLSQEVVDGLRLRIKEKKLKISVMADEGAKVLGQEDDYRQLLLILVDNAILYTPQHGEISLRIQLTGNEVSLIIHNTGVSIPQSELPLLFNRFYRGKDVVEPGTGLGLAIARTIVEKSGGSIAVASQDETKGVTFRVLLPLAKSANQNN